jgi:hypothetical protein
VKQLTSRSRLMMRVFNLQERSQDGNVREFRFRSADVSQITKFLTWPVECKTVGARVRTQRKRSIFDQEEGHPWDVPTRKRHAICIAKMIPEH